MLPSCNNPGCSRAGYRLDTGNFTYGLDISNLGILASVLNENGETNKWGKSINANQLKQVIHRIRSKGLLSEFPLDWSEFSHPSSIGYAYKNMVHMKSDLTRTIPRQFNQVGNLQPNTL